MSFENMKEAKINNTHERSCIMIVNFNAKEQSMIRNVSSLMGIKDQIILKDKNNNSIVRELLNSNILDDCNNGIKDKAIIFNNIPHAKINAFLGSLKKVKINNILSAVVTETSIDWTLNKLLMNLVEERKAMKSGKIVKH